MAQTRNDRKVHVVEMCRIAPIRPCMLSLGANDVTLSLVGQLANFSQHGTHKENPCTTSFTTSVCDLIYRKVFIHIVQVKRKA